MPRPSNMEIIRRAGTGQTSSEEIDREVEAEFQRDFKKIKPAKRCQICSDKVIRNKVNLSLAHGLTWVEILQSLQGENKRRAKNRQFTLSGVRNHAENHFNLEEPAMAVYRRILERRAAEDRENAMVGVGSIVTVLGYLEVMGQKGYETMMSEGATISPELGMNAMLKLHAITSAGDGNERELVELRRKVSQLGTAVRDVIPEEMWPQILARLDELSDNTAAEPLDVEVAELEEADEADEEPFEPDDFPDEEDTMVERG